MLHPLIRRLVVGSLRASFRRVCWVGPLPDLPAGRPVVLYANHHSFHDGYLLWYLVRYVLERTPIVWMEEWDRYPFFAPVGARPFPAGDARRRGATIRRTARHFREHAGTGLVYFPEGILHAPEEGILPFSPEPLKRLGRVLAPCTWLPVAIHLTWENDALPSAFLTSGPAHHEPNGRERDVLATVLRTLRAHRPSCTQLLLEGRRSPHETWRSFSFIRRFFTRYL